MIFNFTVQDKYEKSAKLLKVLYFFILESFKEKADSLKVNYDFVSLQNNIAIYFLQTRLFWMGE